MSNENDETEISTGKRDQAQEETKLSDKTPPGTSPAPPPAQVAADPLIGRKVDNFKIIALLGKGAFGKVYKARDESLGREAQERCPVASYQKA